MTHCARRQAYWQGNPDNGDETKSVLVQKCSKNASYGGSARPSNYTCIKCGFSGPLASHVTEDAYRYIFNGEF